MPRHSRLSLITLLGLKTVPRSCIRGAVLPLNVLEHSTVGPTTSRD